MTDSIICIGSIEYAITENLEKQPIKWIRFKIICEADGRTLWHDTCRTIADVAQTMTDNDIKYHSIINPEPNIFIVRAQPESLAELKDWPSDEMCVRTFYTLYDNENNDLFNTDSCWLSNGLVELKTIDYWYRMIKQIEMGAKV
jgi:hypothetical protein